MFEDFWKQYPRKVARKDAERAWNKLTPEQKFAALHSLPIHVRYWEAAGRTKETTPHAATWLHGERWADELEATVIQAWWTSDEGTAQYGASKGIPAKPGESMASYRARLRAA